MEIQIVPSPVPHTENHKFANLWFARLRSSTSSPTRQRNSRKGGQGRCDLNRKKQLKSIEIYFDFVYGIHVDTREKPTANRRESALRARRIGFASPHSRKSLARQSLARLRPPLRVSPPSTCSSLHRERSGKSCRRPSASQR